MRSPARALLLALVLAPLLVPGAHATRTYKWVDDDGVTHYSQHPPPDREAKVIEPNVALPSDAEASNGKAGANDSEGGRETAADETGGDEPGDMEAYCTQLRDQLQILNSSRDVQVQNDDGTLTPLEGDARAARRADVAARISQNCSG